MDDFLEDYILLDALSVTEDNYCRSCMIGILEAVSEVELVCDICHQAYRFSEDEM